MTPLIGVVDSQKTGKLKSYWISYVANPTQVFSGLTVDSDDNVYQTYYNGTYSGIMKFDKNSNILLQKVVNTATQIYGYNLKLGPDNFLYECGQLYNSGSPYSTGGYIKKWSTSGSLIWQKTVGLATNGQYNAYDISFDSSGNIFLCGGFNAWWGSAAPDWVKINTSGVYQSYGMPGGNSGNMRGISFDSSGNFYTSAQANISSVDSVFISKWTSGTNIAWTRKIASGSGSSNYIGRNCVDSNGNSYATVVQGNGQGGSSPGIVKFDTNGNTSWTKFFYIQSASYGIINDIKYDPTRNEIWVTGITSGTVSLWFAKFDASNGNALAAWEILPATGRYTSYSNAGSIFIKDSDIYIKIHNGTSTFAGSLTLKAKTTSIPTGTYILSDKTFKIQTVSVSNVTGASLSITNPSLSVYTSSVPGYSDSAGSASDTSYTVSKQIVNI